jgi:hypothetical protein
VAHGGGGGGGASNDYGAGANGYDGLMSQSAARGGLGNDDHGCPLYGYTSGGHGGLGSVGASPGGEPAGPDSVTGCSNGDEYVGSGGGGGGSGRIRINTTTGCQCGGLVSPPPTLGTVRWSP